MHSVLASSLLDFFYVNNCYEMQSLCTNPVASLPQFDSTVTGTYEKSALQYIAMKLVKYVLVHSHYQLCCVIANRNAGVTSDIHVSTVYLPDLIIYPR